MNHVKCIFNTNVPRRVSSNTGATYHSNCRNEGSFKKRSAKPRSPVIDDSFMLAVKKVYPFLVQRHPDDTRLVDNRREMLRGTQGSKSKSIATSLKRLLSERKLPLRYVDGINSKQAVRFGSSSSLSYDRTISYDDDRDSRSYAQMITAYNETMMTIDNASRILQDRSNSKLNVQLSKTLFRTTSTLTSSSAYNLENVTIKENTEETSMTDLSYAIDTIIDNDDGTYGEKTKNLDVYSSTTIPKMNERSYANIIADYSAAMDVNSIMNKYRNDFPKMSSVSFSSPEATALETPRVERNVSEFVSSPDLGIGSCKKVNTKEELEWLRKVDKIINDLKTATRKTSTKVNQRISGLKENNVLECVTEQAVWVDKSTLTNTKKSNVVTPRETARLKDQAEEMQNRETRAERTDKTAGLQASHNGPTSSNIDSTSRKDWTQIPRSTETSISTDPQVELRMVPSGNESIVSVNVEAIARAMESRNPDSKELSVIVSSNNKETMKHRTASTREGNSNFGSMRISINEESLPVKELELSINGKPISDVRSIKARTETLNVLTSMDKVEIRVPYLQDNPGKVNPNTKSFVKNVQSAESVLKLRIATAFDGTYPALATGVTKNVQAHSNIQPGAPNARYAHTEESNVSTKLSEVSPATKNQSSQESSVKTTEKSVDKSSKKTFGYNINQDKSEESAWAKIKNKHFGGSNTSTSLGGGDTNKSVGFGDIDLRLTKTFGRIAKPKDTQNKMNTKNIIEVKKDNPEELKTAPDGKKAESPKDVKSASEKDGIKSLADLIVKHAGRSTDGNSSGVSGKPKFGSNQNHEGSNPPGNKRDSKTMDEGKKKTTFGNQSSKTDMFDQHISSKWSPWWSSSDTYVKLKKEEDYHRSYSTPTNVTEKQKAKKFDSTDKVPPKTTKESSRASEEEKTLSAKSQDPSKSKERKHETKESTSASSKVRDVERTLKSPFKSENIRVTRHDSPRVNEKIKRHSFSRQTKIAEEKLNKRNEGPSKKETWNASTLKEVESRRDVDTKDEVKVSIKETPKIDARSKSADTRKQAQENIVDAKSKDKLASDDEKSRNEKLIRQEASSTNGFPETRLNMQQNVKREDSASNVTKPIKSANNLSDEDSRLKDILNFMKPIKKKKDGTLIDYGVKVASRKKPEKLKGRPKFDVETSDVSKEKATADQRLDSPNDIKTSYTVQQINVNMQNPIKYSPRNVGLKEEDKAKKETVSAEDKDVNKDKNPVNLSESKKESSLKPMNPEKVAVDSESLNERISKVLERAKDRIPYQNVIKESPIANNVREMQKVNEDKKEINSEAIKPEKVAGNDESSHEQISKTLHKSKDPIPYQNVNKETSKYSFKKEEPANVKKAEQKSDEDIREPFEGTVIPKPSKSSNSVTTDTGRTEPFAGTIVRRSSKDLEKKKPKNVSYKHSSNTIKSPLNATEKPNTPPSADKLETKANQSKGDSSESQNNSGAPSSPVNLDDQSSPKMTKLNSHPLKSIIDLDNPNEYDKLRCKEKIKQIDIKSVDESLKSKRPDKELVYSVWLQRSKEKTDDKKP